MEKIKLYFILLLSVAGEVVGTTAIANSEQLTRVLPVALAGFSYVVAFWLLANVLKAWNAGVVYALWSSVGVVLIAAVNWAMFGQSLDTASLVGMVLILVGVCIINLASRSLYK